MKIMTNRESIILIGMSGAGKSTLGVLLAKAAGLDFLDTDILIQQAVGSMLQDIVDREGVESFLSIEEEIVSAVRAENTVIATGGSVVYSDKTMQALKKLGRVVYLYVEYDNLVRRITNINTRGIIYRKGNTLREVYDERLPLYERYADLTVNCSRLNMEECVRAIIQGLGLTVCLD